MAVLEELRHAIETVEDMQSIARTMKALSAASIHQYEQALESLVEYRRSVDLGLAVALRDVTDEANATRRSAQRRLAAIIFGSDRGLCGRFNEEIADFAVAGMNGLQVHQQDRRVLAVGARVEARLEQLRQPLQECFFVPGSVAAISETVQDIVLKLEEWRTQHQIGQAWLYYHHHSRQGRQPRALRLLPFDFERLSEHTNAPWPSRSLPTYSMERQALIAALLRQHIFISLFHACAESLAAEHAGRLASMQAAEKNIKEHAESLAMRFRQQRQEAITEELLDVVAGFEVLTAESGQQNGTEEQANLS